MNNPSGYAAINSLNIGAVIRSEEKGNIDAIWHKGKDAMTADGSQVLWGYFYASPSDVT